MRYYNNTLFKKTSAKNDNYFDIIKSIFSHPPKSDDVVAFFKEIMIDSNNFITKYQQNKISIETLKELSKIFIKEKELLKQTFFNPFPEELILEVDPDRDKNYWR